MCRKRVWIMAGLLALCVTACGSDAKDDDKKDAVEAVKDTGSGTETSPDTEGAESTEQKEEDYDEIVSQDEIKDYGSVVVIGDSAYELYTYREDSAKNYVKAIGQLGKALEGTADVYDMVVPLGSGIVFPDNLKDQVNSTDQKEAIDTIYSMLGDTVRTVDIYPALMKHRKEYVYFRTDHHWTALGAYYAYSEFCKEKGIEPEDLESLEKKQFSGFLGSFYKDTKESPDLKNNPDVIDAYVPKANASLNVTASDGTNYDWNIIYDVSDYAPGIKYSTFVAGDNPISVITNKDLTDGSSCVVVKESFGNALIPFLVDHYQTIYIIDYRYWTGDLAAFVKEKNAKDVLFINNLSIIRNQYLVGQLQSIIK